MSTLDFIAITGASEAQAKRFLQQNNNQLEAALSAFFDANEPAQGAPSAPVASPAVVVAAPPPVVEANPAPPVAAVAGATLVSVGIKASMQDLVLDTTAVLCFQNKQAASIEATFSFRSEATVYGFEIEIGGKTVVGQCKEKTKALNDYDDGISAGGRGFLLEKKETGGFNLALGNLGSGDTGKLTLRFVEEVAVDDAGNALVEVPLVALAPAGGLAECEVALCAPDVARVETPSGHAVEQRSEKDRVVVLVAGGNGMQRELRLVVAFHENGLPFPTVESDGATTAVALSFVPRIQLGPEDDPVTEVVFLIDRSGSMSGSRLRQVKAALQLMLRSFPAGSMFDLVSFGSSHESLFGRSVQYDEKTFLRASQAVDAYQANLGGTELLRPLREILSRPDSKYPVQIVLLTDGDVSNADEVIAMTAQFAKTTRVFALGIGSDASPTLIKGVAKAGRGHAEMTVSGQRLEPVIASLCNRVFRPVIKRVAMDWGDLAKSVRFQTPAAHGVVFSGQKLANYAVLFENDRAKHQVTLSVELTGGQVKKYVAEVDLGQTRPGQTAHRLAVASLVADFEAKAAPKDLPKADIVALACKYGVASSLTSLVAVDTSEDRPAPGALMQVKGGEEVRDSFGGKFGGREYMWDDGRGMGGFGSGEDWGSAAAEHRGSAAAGGGNAGAVHPRQQSQKKGLFSVKKAASQNIDKAVERNEQLEELEDRVDELLAESQSFSAGAGKKKSGGGFFGGIGAAVGSLFGGGGAAPPPPPAAAPQNAMYAVDRPTKDKWSEFSDGGFEGSDRKRESEAGRRSPSPTNALRKKASKELAKDQRANSGPLSASPAAPPPTGVGRGAAVKSARAPAAAKTASSTSSFCGAAPSKPATVAARYDSLCIDAEFTGAAGEKEEEDDAEGGSLFDGFTFNKEMPAQQQQQQQQHQQPQAKPKAADPNARPLDIVAGLAGFDGLFELDEALAAALRRQWSAIAQPPPGVPAKAWATALAMAFLQLYCADVKVEWDLLFAKCSKALLRLKCSYDELAPQARALLQ